MSFPFVSMPWYITLVLFLVAPVYAMAVRDYVSPKIKDWWAARSNATLRTRIETLQKSMGNPEFGPNLMIRTSEIVAYIQRSRTSSSLNWLGVSALLALCLPYAFAVLRNSPTTSQEQWILFGVGAVLIINMYFYNAVDAFLIRKEQRNLRKYTDEGRTQLQREIHSLVKKLEAKGGDSKGLLPDPDTTPP